MFCYFYILAYIIINLYIILIQTFYIVGMEDIMYQQQSTTKGFAILGITNVICKVLAIIYLPFQTMILGNTGNGIVSSGYYVYLFIYSLTNAGLNLVISKLVAEQNAVGNYKGSLKILKIAFIVLLSLGAFFAVILIAFANPIAENFAYNKDANLMLIMLAPTFIFTSISCALRGFFQGRRNMMPTALSQIIEQILNSVLTVVFAGLLIGYGLKYGAAGTTVGTSVGALGAALFLIYIFSSSRKQRKHEIIQSQYKGTQLTDGEIFKEIIKYSLPALLSTVAFSASNLIDLNTCVNRLNVAGVKDAISQWGIYSNQYLRMFTLAVAFVTAICTAIIPAISAAHVNNDVKMLRSKIRDCYKAIFIITIPSIAGLTFLAQPILTMVFFKNNQGADFIMLGTWTAIFLVIMNVQMAILIGIGKPLIAPVNLILGMIIKFVLNYALIAVPQINIKGAILGTLIGWVIACLLNQYAINLNLNKRVPYMHLLILPTIVSIVMGIGAMLIYNASYAFIRIFITSNMFCNDVGVIIAIAGAVCIYVTLMIMLHGINAIDILRLPMGQKLYKIIGKMPFLKRELERQGE
jgi:stage V sporulation protein B